MKIETTCIVCDRTIDKPLVDQLTCGSDGCRKKYKKIREEAKSLGLDLPIDSVKLPKSL